MDIPVKCDIRLTLKFTLRTNAYDPYELMLMFENNLFDKDNMKMRGLERIHLIDWDVNPLGDDSVSLALEIVLECKVPDVSALGEAADLVGIFDVSPEEANRSWGIRHVVEIEEYDCSPVYFVSYEDSSDDTMTIADFVRENGIAYGRMKLLEKILRADEIGKWFYKDEIEYSEHILDLALEEAEIRHADF